MAIDKSFDQTPSPIEGGITNYTVIKPSPKEIRSVSELYQLNTTEVIRFGLTGEMPERMNKEFKRKAKAYDDGLSNQELAKSASNADISEEDRGDSNLGAKLIIAIYRGENIGSIGSKDVSDLQKCFDVLGKESVYNIDFKMGEVKKSLEIIKTNKQTNEYTEKFRDSFFTSLMKEYLDPDKAVSIGHSESIELLNELLEIYQEAEVVDPIVQTMLDEFKLKISKEEGTNQAAPQWNLSAKSERLSELIKGKIEKNGKLEIT